MTREELEKKWLNQNVVVYSDEGRFTGKVIGFGSIESRHGIDALEVFAHGESQGVYFIKQCRILRKRERRRLWVTFYSDGSFNYAYTAPIKGSYEFIEVLKKDKPWIAAGCK